MWRRWEQQLKRQGCLGIFLHINAAYTYTCHCYYHRSSIRIVTPPTNCCHCYGKSYGKSSFFRRQTRVNHLFQLGLPVRKLRFFPKGSPFVLQSDDKHRFSNSCYVKGILPTIGQTHMIFTLNRKFMISIDIPRCPHHDWFHSRSFL